MEETYCCTLTTDIETKKTSIFSFLSLIPLSKMGQPCQELGGGLYVNLNKNNYHHVYMRRSQFISNSARIGGGLYLKSSSIDCMHDIILSWLLISENHAEEGGGMYMTHYERQIAKAADLVNAQLMKVNLTVEHSNITFNCAQKEGGGISVLITAIVIIQEVSTPLRN